MSAPTHLTVNEVAAELQVHPQTVRRWLREGKLAGRRTPGGRDYRVPVAALEHAGELGAVDQEPVS